jgi:hypothetical protein
VSHDFSVSSVAYQKTDIPYSGVYCIRDMSEMSYVSLHIIWND